MTTTQKTKVSNPIVKAKTQSSKVKQNKSQSAVKNLTLQAQLNVTGNKDHHIISLLARGNNSEILTLLNTLEDECNSWVNGSYKKSNDELYQLLANCFEFCGQLNKRDSKQRLNSLKQFYEVKKYRFNEDASLAKKVVGAVFGNIDRRRIGTYAVVLEAAKKAKIERKRLPEWIEQQGGIEEIRLSQSKNFISPAAKSQFVSENFSALPSLGIFKSDKLSFKTDSDKNGKNCIFLAKQKADGSFDIRQIIYNTSVVKAAYVSMYKEHKQQVDQTKITKLKAKL